MNNICLRSLYLLLVLVTVHVADAKNNTPDFYKCYNRVKGSWDFGRAPYACDLKAFSNPTVMHKTYNLLLFDDRISRSPEQDRYMQEMYGFIKDSSAYYIRSRRPSVSQTEIDNWAEAMYAVAHQESFWSHFRVTSSSIQNLKMMRGDSGHGHGMMQIDDRWHFTKITSGRASNLITNMIYAFEIYYDSWQRAAKASCVRGASDWKARARSAYSMYNGGQRQACRWTDPNNRWALNDRNFLDKYNKRYWKRYVANTSYSTPLDLQCLFGGNENCGTLAGPNPAPQPTPQPPQPSPEPAPPTLPGPSNVFYKSTNGEICGHSQGEYICFQDTRDRACLNAALGTNIDTLQSVPTSFYSGKKKSVIDRHQLCPDAVEGLLAVGSDALMQKSINMRATPGGQWVGQARVGSRLQILDFEVFNGQEKKRYYKVSSGGKVGYVYAGDKDNYSSWVLRSTQKSSGRIIATADGRLRIRNAGGINQRQTPGGSLIQRVPAGTELEVSETLVKGTQNTVYYKIQYRGQSGYIYGGRALPKESLSRWIAVID